MGEICRIDLKASTDDVIESVVLSPCSADTACSNKASSSSIQSPLCLSESHFSELLIDHFLGKDVEIFYELSISGVFNDYVYRVLRSVKYGETITYKELARLVGNERAARAVGNALRVNPLHLILPCHRVVSQTGLGGFHGKQTQWINIKEKLLMIEKNDEVIRVVPKV